MKTHTAHFIIRPEHIAHLEQLHNEPVDKHWPLFNAGPECWGLLTYLLLRQAGMQVTAGTEARDEVVNVVFATLTRAFQVPSHAWMVVVRADYRAIWSADEHLVQNQMQQGPLSTWIPLWPQTGLIPRRPDRTVCERVGFFGLSYYLAGQLSEWNRQLADLQMTMEIRDPSRWNDYSDVDVVMAIRTFDDYPYPRKPASKLINAWLAGVPAIVGMDSAYRQIAQPEADFLVANSMETAIAQIRRLRTEPGLYEQLVKHGRDRSTEFTRNRVIDRWRQVLETAEARRQSQSRGLKRWLGWAFKNAAQGTYAFTAEAKRRMLGHSKLSR